MAAHTSILLLAALCIGTAYSLRCYTCTAQTSNRDCQTATMCSSGENYCQTIVVSGSAGGYSATGISKTCSTTCTTGSYSSNVGSSSISCCSTDLCNVSGAVSIKSTYSTIFLVLGTIVMLFSSSLL